MTRMHVDFPDDNYEPVPVGDYVAEISKVELRAASGPGKFEKISVEFVIMEGPWASRRVWENLSFSPKALFRMRGFFALFGYNKAGLEFDVDDESQEIVEPDLKGRAVGITVGHRDWEGQTKEDVEDVRPLGPNPVLEEEDIDLDEPPHPADAPRRHT